MKKKYRILETQLVHRNLNNQEVRGYILEKKVFYFFPFFDWFYVAEVFETNKDRAINYFNKVIYEREQRETKTVITIFKR